jgi:hypothetical protein
MNATEIKLSNGKKVNLEEFKMNLTYGGLLVGKPNTQLNYKIIRDVIDSFKGKKIVLTLEDAYVSKERLKPYVCSARLSSEPTDKEFDISYLNVVWFRNDIATMTIEQMIRGLDIDWDFEAEDFKF